MIASNSTQRDELENFVDILEEMLVKVQNPDLFHSIGEKNLIELQNNLQKARMVCRNCLSELPKR